jgi:hypothetical protein
MKKNNNILTISAIVLVIIIGAALAWQASSAPSKYEPFAQGMKDAGTKFYGAFWCPHCQAQEKELGMSRQELEKMGLYIECSPSNGQGQTKICSDAKIESYPTWVYAKDFSVTTTVTPTICEVQPGPADQSPTCTSYGSKFMKSWVFSIGTGLTVQSLAEPKHEGDVWTFVAGSRTTGEVSLKDLSTFTGIPLPAESK